MADDFLNVLSSTDQIRNNYEQFKSKFVDKDKDLISQETFLKLLLAEMSNQDPLEPTTNTEFISQLAQFSSMQYMQDSSKYAMATYASSLVGKTVSASKFDGPDLIMKTGVVQSVKYQNNTYIVTIDGEDFDISKVTSVVDGGTSGGGAQSSDSLADRIAKASQMVGMYAFVKTGNKAEDGSDEIIHGFIESITVQNGEIKIVVGGEVYDMESIDELTYATIIDDSEGLSDRIARASQMVGMYASVKTGEQDEDGNDILVQGIIQAITVENGKIKIVIDGEVYNMENIDELTGASPDPEKPEEPGETDNVNGGVENAGGTEDTDGTSETSYSAAGINGLRDVPDLNDILNRPTDNLTPDEEQELLNQLQSLISSMM